MARASGVGAITAAVVTRLASDSDLQALVGDRIYQAPQGARYPYLRVGVVSESADDAIGAAGVDAVVEVLIVSNYDGDKEIGQIATAVRSRLELAPLVVAGFSAPADVTYEQALGGFTQSIGSVPVRHRPLWFRVRVS